MNVVSLFDGMSCGQIALERAGVPVDKYYAAEIDKFAIRVTQKNYWDTIQMGGVETVDPDQIDRPGLLIGGSPCQGFSFVGDRLNFDDPRSRLFFEFVRIKEAFGDIPFMLENVPMAQESEDIITERLGVSPICIDSQLVSAQRRRRLYWTNIPGVDLPASREVNLSEILIDNPPEYLKLSDRELAHMDRQTADGRSHWDLQHHHDTAQGKSHCLPANLHKGVPYNVLIDRRGKGDPIIRKLDPVEAERLQTVPDNYTAGVVSNTQRYKMLGNGWTVDVVSHIFRNLK